MSEAKKWFYLCAFVVLIWLVLIGVAKCAPSSKGSDVMIRMHMDGSWDMYIFEPCPGTTHVKPQHDRDDPIHVVCER